MRKRCVSCGLICFATDESCKRCGSSNLAPFNRSDEALVEKAQSPLKPLSVWNYLAYFLLAAAIEFAALLPILSNLGMRHSSAAPVSNHEFYSLIIIIILHLPTILITWTLSQVAGGDVIIWTPLLQIAFWTFLFVYFARRKRIKSNRQAL